jgi:hypothetical protein
MGRSSSSRGEACRSSDRRHFGVGDLAVVWDPLTVVLQGPAGLITDHAKFLPGVPGSLRTRPANNRLLATAADHVSHRG